MVEILKVGRGAFPNGGKRLFLIQGEIFDMIFGAFFLAEYLLRLVQVDVRNWKSDHLTSSTIEEIINPNQKFERPMPQPQCVGVFFSCFFPTSLTSQMSLKNESHVQRIEFLLPWVSSLPTRPFKTTHHQKKGRKCQKKERVFDGILGPKRH